jgi:hypothetical protein
MTEPAKSDSGLEVSTKGVSVKGDAYEDVRPIVQATAKLAETILSVANNVVGLPADYLNHHLETFRKRFQEKVAAIPDERRTAPPLRIGCSVLKEVAAAAEEPEIQQMFADLLGTSCDTDTQSQAHPGFASVISQLTPFDARFLRRVSDAEAARTVVHPDDDTVLNNLLRLGLLEWATKTMDPLDRMTLRNTSSSRRAFTSGDGMPAVSANEFGRFKDELATLLEKLGQKRTIRLTPFGKQFIKACLPAEDSTSGK